MGLLIYRERSGMKTYTLTDTRNRHGEVFDQAMTEPVLLTKQSRPSHVILSVQAYQDLIERLSFLENLAWGHAALDALRQANPVGSERFVAELEQLANGEA
jgi:prevent-host-death family protein